MSAILVIAVRVYGEEPAPEPILAAVEVDGVAALSEADARAALGWREGMPFDPESVEEAIGRLLERYREAGYLFASVPTPEVVKRDGAVVLRVHVQEGKRARLASVAFRGLKAVAPDAARRALDVRIGEPFDATRWRRGTQRLLRRYAEDAHPFAEITPEVVDADPDTGRFSLLVHVKEGPAVSIERVEIVGLHKTREGLVRRIIPIRAGDRYDQRRIDDARYALRNSGYFTSLHPNTIVRGSKPNLVVYRARLEEARTARIAGVLGYAPPRSETDAPQLTGLLEATEANLLGTGREIAFRWESGENRSTRLLYREPFLFGQPVSATVEWNTERYEGVLRRMGVARLDWAISVFVRGGVGVQTIRTDRGSGTGLLAEAALDTRDYRLNPSRGWFVTFRGDAYTGRIAFRRLGVEAQTFLSVARRQVLAARVAAGRLFGMDIPLTEWYFLGGAATLRGYRERQFRGTSRVLAGIEYRLLTGPESHAFAFLDVGQIARSGVRAVPKIGYGLGVNIKSRGGRVRLQYGLSPGTSPLEGKIHIQLGTVF